MLREHGVVLAVENHPEQTPAEVLAKIEAGRETMRATVDTGWWATQGYDPARAIEELGPHVVHVHLKDVLHEGEPHETCPGARGSSTSRPASGRCSGSTTSAPTRSSTSRRITTPARRSGRCASGSRSGSHEGRPRRGGKHRGALRRGDRGDGLELAGATDVDPEPGAELVRDLGGRAYASLADLLADETVDTIVNLTVPQAHFEVRRGRWRRVSTSTARSRSR